MTYASNGLQGDVDVFTFPSSQQQPPPLPPFSCPHFDSHSPCHVCFTELLHATTSSSSSPRALTIHVSHALSLLSRSPSHPQAHLLVPPLLHALSSFNDGPIASQIVEVLLLFCDSSSSSGGESLVRDVVAGLLELVSSTAFGWSKAHVYAVSACCFLVPSTIVDSIDMCTRKYSRFNVFWRIEHAFRKSLSMRFTN